MTYLPEGTLKNSAEAEEFNARYGALRRAIGANIEHVRKGQNMPLKKLAKRTGFSAERLDYWEMGRMEINLASIIRIAAALGVPQSTLLATREAANDNGADKKDTEDPDEEEDPGPKAGTWLRGDGQEESLWLSDDSFETQLEMAVVARERRKPMGFPDRNAIFAMEEPMSRLMGAAILFNDHATAMETIGEDPRAIGFSFLSDAMRREMDRVYRLYFGHPHDGGTER